MYARVGVFETCVRVCVCVRKSVCELFVLLKKAFFFLVCLLQTLLFFLRKNHSTRLGPSLYAGSVCVCVCILEGTCDDLATSMDL